MKITVFNGSPRAEKGNTHVMVEEFLKGAREAGAETENIFLAHKNIKHCLGCFACWIKTPGHCAIKDDMAELLPKITTSDVVVFATPLYVDHVTGIMKNFIDRMIPLGDPHFEKDANGESRHLSAVAGKIPKIAVISNCGFPEQSHFQVLELYFRRFARNMHSEVVAEIYRGAGEIFKGSSIFLALPIMNYKKLLRKAGKEVVQNTKLSDETKRELEKPLIPDDLYIKEANKYWDKVLKSL